MSELITQIVQTPMRKNVTPLMRQTLAEMGVPVESPRPLFAPMLANTVTPTILRAGYKDNVIPGEASDRARRAHAAGRRSRELHGRAARRSSDPSRPSSC